jgi:hypothetical protein
VKFDVGSEPEGTGRRHRPHRRFLSTRANVALYWQHLCDQVAPVVKRKKEKKRQVKIVKVQPHLKLKVYRDPRPAESLLFMTSHEISCLRSYTGNMIVFGMCDVPSLEEK